MYKDKDKDKECFRLKLAVAVAMREIVLKNIYCSRWWY